MTEQNNNIDKTLNKPLELVPSIVCGVELVITLIVYSFLKHFCGLIYGEFFIVVVLAYYIYTTMKLTMPEIEKEIKENIEHEKQNLESEENQSTEN